MGEANPVPPRASDPRWCGKGGKHTPVTREGKSGSIPIKFKVCLKCGGSLA